MQFLKSPRAAVRIAAARRFLGRLDPGAPFLAIGQHRHAADRLCHEIIETRELRKGALLGAFRYGFAALAARLAAPELAARGMEPLSPAVRLACVVRVLHRARRAGTLGRFGEVARGPGLAARLASTFDELRRTGISAQGTADADPDLGRLYSRYIETLDGSRLADRAEIFDAARRNLEAGATPFARRPVGLPAVFLDVPLHDRSAKRFAAALAAASPAVLFTIPTGDDLTGKTVLDFGAAPDAGGEVGGTAPDDAVAAVQQCLFETRRPDPHPDPSVEPCGLTVISAPGNAAEALAAARIFLAEASGGTAFDRMAVLLPNPGRQASGFREAFQRAGIPAFFEAGARLPHPAGRAFLALLDCAREDLSAARFAEYLSLGETPGGGADHGMAPGEATDPEGTGQKVDDPWATAPPGASDRERGDEEAPRRWERLIRDAEVIGGLDRWKRRLARFRDQLRRDEEAEEDPARREQIRLRREDMRRLTETALPILNLLDRLPAPHARFGEWAEHLGTLARTALLHPEGVIECLDETAPMREVDEVTLIEIRRSLGRRLSEVVPRSRGSRYGQVWVGPIEAVRGLDFEIVAAPGLSERAFPRPIREDPMLPDRQRRLLSPELPLREDFVERERLRLRLVAGAATRRLFLSYSSLDLVEGRQQVPSYHLAEAFRAGLGRIPTLGAIRKAAGESSGVLRGLRAPKDSSLAIDRREFDLSCVAKALGTPETPGRPGAAAFLVSNPALGRALRQEYLRQSRKWQSTDGFLFPNQPALAALAAHRPANRAYSATGLESFAACPYQFFLKNLIRLRPTERPDAVVQLDPLSRGSLLHEVFFHLGQQFRAQGLAPLTEARLDEAYSVLDDVFRQVEAEQKDRLAPAVERIWRDQMDGLLGDLRGFLERLAGTGVEIVANEFTFGMPARQPADPRSTSEPVLLPGGLRLHGSIDAVERLPDGTTRITDYKTGRASTETWRNRNERILFGGKSMQPLLYALAQEALSGEPVASGRLYYSTVRGAYLQTEVDTGSPESRQVFEKFLAALDRAVAHGRLPAHPDPGLRYLVCDSCDYLPVCGPHPAAHHRTKAGPEVAAALREAREIRQLP